MKISIEDVHGVPYPCFEDEVPPRSWLLSMYLSDMRGQEDLYLDFLERAAAGEDIRDLYNQSVEVFFFKDQDLVVLEDMRDLDVAAPDAEGPARCAYLSFAEARQLILDWLAAKRDFYAARAAG